MEDWAKMVKEVRKQNGWTQKGLAKRLGVCCAEVNRWEKGHNEPRGEAWRRLKEMCKELGIDDSRDEEIMRFIHTLMDNIPWNKFNDERLHIQDLKTGKDCGTLKEYISERMKTLFGVIVEYGKGNKE